MNNILLDNGFKSSRGKRRDSLDFNRRRKKFDFRKWQRIGIFSLEVLAVILLAYFIVRSLGIKSQNFGESMEDTLGSGDYVLVDRLIYKIKSPKINDIIMFRPKDSSSPHSIKRVVGVPGDHILIKDGILYVNNKAKEEETSVEHIENAGLAEHEIVLKDDEYFVLGDNRNNSEDSRYDFIGNVKKKDIIGKVWFDISAGHFGLL
ncbi:MAG: signal peptidase I [Lachnospiraceae bacterium]|nr:signal peptidase I [Lachnospiraceae bacterium]